MNVRVDSLSVLPLPDRAIEQLRGDTHFDRPDLKGRRANGNRYLAVDRQAIERLVVKPVSRFEEEGVLLKNQPRVRFCERGLCALAGSPIDPHRAGARTADQHMRCRHYGGR